MLQDKTLPSFRLFCHFSYEEAGFRYFFSFSICTASFSFSMLSGRTVSTLASTKILGQKRPCVLCPLVLGRQWAHWWLKLDVESPGRTRNSTVAGGRPRLLGREAKLVPLDDTDEMDSQFLVIALVKVSCVGRARRRTEETLSQLFPSHGSVH